MKRRQIRNHKALKATFEGFRVHSIDVDSMLGGDFITLKVYRNGVGTEVNPIRTLSCSMVEVG